MASISLTSANIRLANAYQCDTTTFVAGAALTVGYAVYIDSNGYVQHADADASEAAARAIGIVVQSFDGETSVASGSVASVCLLGPVEGYSEMSEGEPVYNSKTAGRMDQTAPTAGAYPRAIGYARSTTCIFVNPDTEDPSSV